MVASGRRADWPGLASAGLLLLQAGDDNTDTSHKQLILGVNVPRALAVY